MGHRRLNHIVIDIIVKKNNKDITVIKAIMVITVVKVTTGITVMKAIMGTDLSIKAVIYLHR